jgi:hypothetical protein
MLIITILFIISLFILFILLIYFSYSEYYQFNLKYKIGKPIYKTLRNISKHPLYPNIFFINSNEDNNTNEDNNFNDDNSSRKRAIEKDDKNHRQNT